MNAREFAYKFGDKMSVRVFHALAMRPLCEFTLKEIQQKDFLDIQNVGMKSWNEFVQIRNNYFSEVEKKKTAVQELIEYVEERWGWDESLQARSNKLIKKEKQSIEIAFDLGRDEVTSAFIIDGEDYYNKSYNQNK